MNSELSSFFQNRRVLVTGHTGFKGSWLSEWLLALGANVTGYSNEIPHDSLFKQLALADRLDHRIADIRDRTALEQTIAETRPDVVFHLAAQPLVRLSYADPAGTYETNAGGTVNLLEALRTNRPTCAAVFVTTDKCYENDERTIGYTEDDPLGGYDPYSASKACAELAVRSYRRSYFSSPDSPVRLATARAGNVIGGGDWAIDRIVPDCIRSLADDAPIVVRNRAAIRPWQHVLDPLYGYMILARRLHPENHSGSSPLPPAMDAFNFGPETDSQKPVEDLVEAILKHWPGKWVDRSDPDAPHEASCLALDISRAKAVLNWRPVWHFDQAIEETVNWYRQSIEASSSDLQTFTRAQISSYIKAAAHSGIPSTAALH